MAGIKHVGRIKATNKKCVVAYRTLPGDAYNCLIIPTESIPEQYHDSLLNLVESNTGQTSYELAEALARSSFSDGTIMLSALHAMGKLIKVATDQVEMLPYPGTAILLAELNQLIASQRGVPVDELALKSSTEQDEPVVEQNPVNEDVSKTTSASVNATDNEAKPNLDDPIVAAKYYRSQADKLAKQAAQFRRMADDISPIQKKSRGKSKSAE